MCLYQKLLKNSIITSINNHSDNYPTPTNLSYFWGFGSLAGITLAIQLFTGIFLAMHYTPEINFALISVTFILYMFLILLHFYYTFFLNKTIIYLNVRNFYLNTFFNNIIYFQQQELFFKFIHENFNLEFIKNLFFNQILYFYKNPKFKFSIFVFSISENNLNNIGSSSYQLLGFLCFTATAVLLLNLRSKTNGDSDLKSGEKLPEIKQFGFPEIKVYKLKKSTKILDLAYECKLPKYFSTKDIVLNAVSKKLINPITNLSTEIIRDVTTVSTEIIRDVTTVSTEIISTGSTASATVMATVMFVAPNIGIVNSCSADIAIYVINEFTNDLFFRDGRDALKVLLRKFPIWEQQQVIFTEFRIKPENAVVKQKILEAGKHFLYLEKTDLYSAKNFLDHHQTFDLTHTKKLKFYQCFKTFFEMFDMCLLKDSTLIINYKNNAESISRRFLNQKNFKKCYKPFLQLFQHYFPQG